MPCSASASAVVAEYDTWARSPSTQIRLPSVVALRKYQRAPRRVAFTRFNVFLRDRFTCQYCGEAFRLFGTDVRACHPALTRRPDDLVEHRHGLHALQHRQGQLAAHQASPRAQGANDERAAGRQARVPTRLSARELGRLPLLGRAARGLASSRSSVDQSAAVRRRRSRVQVAPRRPLRKVPLEWPAPRLENGWAPQGVAFEPSAFRQHRCGRSQDRPHHPSSRTDTQAATRPDCRSGAFGLRRFESCSVHQRP